MSSLPKHVVVVPKCSASEIIRLNFTCTFDAFFKGLYLQFCSKMINVEKKN